MGSASRGKRHKTRTESVGELLTVPEAARDLKMSVGHTRRFISQGDLPCVRLGKKSVRVARSDLEAFKAARRHATAG